MAVRASLRNERRRRNNIAAARPGTSFQGVGYAGGIMGQFYPEIDHPSGSDDRIVLDYYLGYNHPGMDLYLHRREKYPSTNA